VNAVIQICGAFTDTAGKVRTARGAYKKCVPTEYKPRIRAAPKIRDYEANALWCVPGRVENRHPGVAPRESALFTLPL
jgi:hypothetical protein